MPEHIVRKHPIGGHAGRIWPALACLRRGELPSPAEVDALIALARGECEAPKQPRLFSDSDGADTLAREWAAAYEAETLLACPALTKVDRSFLASAERGVAGSSQLYGWFHRWRSSGPEFAQLIAPTPKGFAAQLPRVSAWAGPKMAAERRAQRGAEAVAAAEDRPPELRGACEPPPGGFASLIGGLASRKTWKGGGQ